MFNISGGGGFWSNIISSVAGAAINTIGTSSSNQPAQAAPSQVMSQQNPYQMTPYQTVENGCSNGSKNGVLGQVFQMLEQMVTGLLDLFAKVLGMGGAEGSPEMPSALGAANSSSNGIQPALAQSVETGGDNKGSWWKDLLGTAATAIGSIWGPVGSAIGGLVGNQIAKN